MLAPFEKSAKQTTDVDFSAIAYERLAGTWSHGARGENNETTGR